MKSINGVKRPTRKTLLRKSWVVFSEYVRRRDQGTCFTCGKRYWNEELGEVDWRRMHAGHFIHSKLDYNEMNVHCQCPQCNTFNHGNLRVYTLKMIDLYGREAVEDLQNKAHQEKPYTEEFLESVIKLYITKLENL